MRRRIRRCRVKGQDYIYTARSALDPGEALTFTLRDRDVVVALAAPSEEVELRLSAEGVQGRQGLPSWLKPAAISLLQLGTQPLPIADVEARTEGGELGVMIWLRTANLRLVPVAFHWEQVEDPDAAQDFARELRERKAAAERSGRSPRRMLIWGGWFLGGLAVAALRVARRARAKRRAVPPPQV